MAMSKEQQRAASERILAKEPLTEEELQILNLRSKTPDEYQVPGQVRVCGVCAARFQDTVSEKGEIKTAALEKFSDHQAEHNASPAQWAEAHKRIQAAKERAT